MIEFINPEILRYCENLIEGTPDYLDELERKTHLQTLAPQMLSGKLQGRLLSFISRIKQPKLIIEIGTFTGYSALCLAEGLRSDGSMITLEVNSDYDDMIDNIKNQIPLAQKIQFLKESALKYLPECKLHPDIVFIDGSKKEYLKYLDCIEPLMLNGSILITDNVLWYGKVVSEKQDDETRIIDTYNRRLKSSGLWDVMILPVRDGISIATKK